MTQTREDPAEGLATDWFSIAVVAETERDGIRTTSLHVSDRFSAPRHRLVRSATQSFISLLERYLRAHPEVTADSRRNLVRALVYFPAGVRSWAEHIPGAFATYPVHNPDVAVIRGGHRLDPITRALFRHSPDGIGLRSRAYAMAWAVHRAHGNTKRPVRWLSLASGTGHQTLEAADLLPHRPELWLTDLDLDALGFARSLAARSAAGGSVRTERLDALDSPLLSARIGELRPDVIDVMGLVEYLTDDQLVGLVTTVRAAAPAGCQLVFTNTLPTHPGLQVHRRGLGWPGVIVRTVDEVCAALATAGAAPGEIHVILPDDQVYGVYELRLP